MFPRKKLIIYGVTALSIQVFTCFANFLFAQKKAAFKTIKPVQENGRFIYRYNTISDTIKPGHVIKTASFNSPYLYNTPANTNTRTMQVNGPLVLYIITTDPTCGYGSGSIIVQATNGTAPYSFAFEQSGYTVVQNTGNYPVAGAGTYNITVTDALGATGTATVTLQDIYPGPVGVFPPTLNCPTNSYTNDASFTVTATGGTPPYTYSLDLINFQTSNQFTNLYPGIYYVYVKDANGCIGSASTYGTFRCSNFKCQNALFLIYGFDGSACGNNGSIDISLYNEILSNGEHQCSPFTYSIDGINYSTSGVFTGIGPGIHNIFIKDNTGELFQVYGLNFIQFCEITIDYIAVDAACQQNDGVLTINATNGTAPYEYTIDGINYQNSNVFSGLAPGNYYVTVRDNRGVKTSKPVTVYDRCPIVRTAVSGETCAKNDGIITAGGFKGTTPYQFSIDGVNFQTSNTFGGLKAGNYTITIRDALGFTGTTVATVPYNCLSVTGTVINSTCGNSNGTITATGANGTAPYQFSIDGVNFQSSNIFTNLKAGNYTLTIKDASGLTATSIIKLPDTLGPTVTATIKPASCVTNDGVVTLTTNTGTAPFQYSIDGTNYTSTNSFTNLTAGNTIDFYIKDANGCVAFKPVTVTLNCPTVSALVKDETCNSSNGTITASGTNGTPPYQYSLDGINFQTNTLFTNLKAGNYTITIKDALTYTNTASLVIKNICPTVTAIGTNGLCGTANASITATGANGATPYEYSIDGINFQSSNQFNNLANGTYTITVRDAAGLKNTSQVTVTNFPPPQISVLASNATCLNNDGNVTINATGGVSPLQYSLDGINFQSASVIKNIAKGIYNPVVKDANGCTTTQPVTVGLTDNLVLSTTGNKTICEGNSVEITGISNGTSFNWTPSTALSNTAIINPSASPVADTKYYVTAELGVCSKTDSLLVFVNKSPVADAGENVTVCYGQNVQLNGSGGIQYKWNPNLYLTNSNIQNPIVTKPLNTITYSLEVTDGNGCKSLNHETLTITVTPMTKVFAGNDTSVAIGEALVLQAIDVNGSGFNSYTWTPAYGLNNSNIANPVTILDRDIKYVVTAVTPQGCEGSDDISIKVFKAPEIFVPNVFTPNGDGKNDMLKAIPVGIKEFKYFTVYNRWGEQVFTTHDSSSGWNGSINGVSQNVQLFTWLSEGIDFTGHTIKRKGTVLLLR